MILEPDPFQDGQLSDEQQMYKENILDHYKHPHNKRVVSDSTYVLAGRNPLCGDAITVYVTVRDGSIEDVAFEGAGCAISQASMSMLTDELKGKTLERLAAMGQDDIVTMLGIPIGPVRMKCAMLGLRTTQEAVAARRS